MRLNADIAVPPLAYRINDAARAVGISRSKLYELVAGGDLHTVRIGGRSVVLACDLQSYVERCARASTKRAA